MKRSIKQWIIVNCQLSIIVLSIINFANAQVITLDSVLSAIDQQNPMLQQFDQRVNAMNTYTAGAKSWMAPMVGAGPYWYPYPGQEVDG
ncbi:MAG: hypothetical protein IPK96_21110 [Flammeovirgaceae bacterium]|nr:hypothetical protein [Flammeovirgaceae bacterium]